MEIEFVRWIILAIVSVILTFAITPWIGPGALHPAKVLAGDPLDRQIFIQFRISRTLLAMVAGGCLSLAGCLFQAMLRNSLATPYTLGVSSGAALGAVVFICAGIPAVWLGAILGAALVLLIVLGFALHQTQLSAHALILAGVSINSVCSALIMLLHSFAGFTQSFSITSWLIGGVDALPFSRLALFAAFAAPACAFAIWQAPAWNLLAVGEHWAAARGASVRRLMIGGYIVGSLLAAITVSLTGPIGFVGLLVPHLVRNVTGADHRLLLPCSLLFGSSFLAICDAFGRTALAPADLPVGVVTALLGGPGLVWMIRSQHARSL
jgi:iron complex transport system permease protein